MLDLADITKIQSLKATNQKIVFTNGCFDILHAGHLKYLIEAKSLGDVLVIGLNSDQSVSRLKGESRPIQNFKDRKFILENLKPVDYVFGFEEDTPLKLILTISPDILVKGGDWKVEDIVGGKEVIKNGGKVRSLEFVNNRSSTSIIEKILNHERHS